jgi:hypothetical protein
VTTETLTLSIPGFTAAQLLDLIDDALQDQVAEFDHCMPKDDSRRVVAAAIHKLNSTPQHED